MARYIRHLSYFEVTKFTTTTCRTSNIPPKLTKNESISSLSFVNLIKRFISRERPGCPSHHLPAINAMISASGSTSSHHGHKWAVENVF